MALAFELAHDVHQVLQQTRTGDGAFLGHMAHQQCGHVALFGRGNDGGRNLAYLRNTAGAALHIRAAQRLHGVNNQQLGLKLLHLAQRLPEVGLR
ncbi:hypothetical protein PJL18_04421 [Paenarthrobacter nicotinovorans]|nr:hypothetical protein [Paenarthrobacter nicotinovorans]